MFFNRIIIPFCLKKIDLACNSPRAPDLYFQYRIPTTEPSFGHSLTWVEGRSKVKIAAK